MFNLYKSLTSILPFSKTKRTYIFKGNYLYTNDSNVYAYLYYITQFNYLLPIDKYSKKNSYSCVNNNVYTFKYFYKYGTFVHLHNSSNRVLSNSVYWTVNCWYERELDEFYNIKFLGSTDCRCLLLPYSYINRKNFYSNESTRYYALKFSTDYRQVLLNSRSDVLV